MNLMIRTTFKFGEDRLNSYGVIRDHINTNADAKVKSINKVN